MRARLLIFAAFIIGCVGGFTKPVAIYNRSAACLPPTCLDLTTVLGRSKVATARTGDPVYVGVGDGTVTTVATNTNVVEDLGDGRGVGILSFPGYSNHSPAPFSFADGTGARGSSLNWTHTGLKTFTPGSSSFGYYAAKRVESANITVVSGAGAGFGNALHFDGATNTPISLDTSFGPTTNFAFEMWVRPTALPGTMYMGGKFGSGSAPEFPLGIYISSGTFGCSSATAGGAFTGVTGTTSPVINTWYLVACDWDGSTLRLFVNGVMEASAAHPSVALGGTNDFAIGDGSADITTHGPFVGDIDEVRLSTVSRHTSNYTVASAPFTSDANTKLLLHMDELDAPYVSGVAAPDGSTNAARFYGTGGRLEGQYNVNTTNNVIACAWVRDATLAPILPGALSAQPGSNNWLNGVLTDGTGMSSADLWTGSAGTWHRICSLWYKSGSSSTDAFKMAFSGGAMSAGALPGGNETVTIDDLRGGGVEIAFPLLANAASAEVPFVESSTGAATPSITDATVLASTLQGNGEFFMSGSYLMGPAGAETLGYAVAYVNADGTSYFRWDGTTTVAGNLNTAGIDPNASIPFTSMWFYGQPAEVGWGLWSRQATDGKYGYLLKYNGCTAMVQQGNTIANPAPTMHAPTAIYLGSDGTGGNYIARRHTRLSFKKFGEYDGRIAVIGDSLVGYYSGLSQACNWVLTLAESRTTGGMFNFATPGHTIEQQQASFDTVMTSTQVPSYKTIWNQVGVNNLNNGDSVATAASKYQTLVNDERTKLPSARIYIAPVTPCNAASNPGCTWSNVVAFNDCLAGGGGGQCAAAGATPITCSGSCVRVSYSATWGTTLDDGTGALQSQYNTGSTSDGHLHENDKARKIIGATMHAQFQANGDLP